MMVRGRFIAIEGVDASGKATQTRLLAEALKRRGLPVRTVEYPQYDTEIGALVARYLRGELGGLHELPAEIPALLYAMDRYQNRDRLVDWIEGGTWVVANRYTPSNLAYQGAKVEGGGREAFIRWIAQVESRLPEPDLVIYLYVPLEVSDRLIAERKSKAYLGGSERDIHEADVQYLRAVVETYLRLAGQREDWVVIDCTRSGSMMEVEEVHAKVVSAIESALGPM